MALRCLGDNMRCNLISYQRSKLAEKVNMAPNDNESRLGVILIMNAIIRTNVRIKRRRRREQSHDGPVLFAKLEFRYILDNE